MTINDYLRVCRSHNFKVWVVPKDKSQALVSYEFNGIGWETRKRFETKEIICIDCDVVVEKSQTTFNKGVRVKPIIELYVTED